MNFKEASDLLDRTDILPVAPVEARAWINLYFDKSGRSFEGVGIYCREDIAARMARVSVDPVLKKKADLAGPDWVIPFSRYSHVFQMPVK